MHRILIPLLSNNQKQLCHLLKNMQEHVLPWNSMDIFVFSPENQAFSNLECPQAVVHCNAALDPRSKPCNVNNTEVFFLPLQEEWRTPHEAGDSALWRNTEWDEGYRRMVSTTSCKLSCVTCHVDVVAIRVLLHCSGATILYGISIYFF